MVYVEEKLNHEKLIIVITLDHRSISNVITITK